ncbi:MAG TPA: hypothetical protein VEC39_12520 [Vicinamibacterales bacterium]|nr:hypothetical protein [Vicinamibacterales bacterium]
MKKKKPDLIGGVTRAQFDEAYRDYARKMDLFMEGPTTTHFQMLVDAGIEIPAPESLTDEALHTKLWGIIHGLARLHAFLSCTDHLSDRELYTKLYHETLRVEEPAVDEIGFTTHISLCTAGDGDDLYMKYYANDHFRESCRRDYPDEPLPPHEDPPYDRDRRLPRPPSRRR